MKKNMSILIVDDSEGDRYLFKRALKEIGGFEKIYEARHGQEAIEFFEQYSELAAEQSKDFPAILIFLDINMPVMGGFEFLERFDQMSESNPELKNLIVMMLSSSENPKDRERAMQSPYVTDFLVKGNYDQQMIENLIEKIRKDRSL